MAPVLFGSGVEGAVVSELPANSVGRRGFGLVQDM